LEKNTANDRQWYYKKQSGRQEFMRGPFTRQEILKKHEDGVIDKDTFIPKNAIAIDIPTL